MNPKQQRIAIAEACGWKHVPKPPELPWGAQAGKPEWYFIHELPDYLNDLNAMHEAEKKLTDAQYRNYCALLDEAGIDERGLGYPNWSRSATASQRAEAFLKAMGTWEDDE